ncbi:MAG: Gfo/Idh/MocA family protein [Planctomycetota bacterium]
MPARDTTTRRSFLKVAAGALTAPWIFPTRAFGDTERAAPSERINIGLIGAGNMGSAHLPALLRHPSVQLVAVCDVHRGRRDAAIGAAERHYADAARRGSFNGVKGYNEFERLLARPDIDAVLIATPDHWHAIIAIAACEAGKDVYCEKPLSLTVREAREMVRSARRFMRVFQTGSQQRSSENFRLACELVRSGRIGEVKKVNVGIDGPSSEKYLPEEPIPDGLDWERWLGPAPWQPYNSERASGSYGGGWRRIRDYSGGMMTDWGAHHLDIVQWGLGMDESGPVEIMPPDDAAGTPLTYRYENGITVERGGANGVLFTGTTGTVEVNRGYLRTSPDALARTQLGSRDTRLYLSNDHLEDWLKCIRTRKCPICDVEVGCRSVTVCHLGCIAWWLGRPLRWDPKTEEIIDDPYASRWLDRPKRAPWHLRMPTMEEA